MSQDSTEGRPRGAHRRSHPSRWIIPVVVGVALASTVYVGHLRLSTIPDRAIGHVPAAPEMGSPRDKTVEYRVSGTPGATARVSYLTPRGTVDEEIRVPWSKPLHSRDLTTAAGVLVQLTGPGRLECTVRVNGQQRAVERAGGDSPVVNCTVPVA